MEHPVINRAQAFIFIIDPLFINMQIFDLMLAIFSSMEREEGYFSVRKIGEVCIALLVLDAH